MSFNYFFEIVLPFHTESGSNNMYRGKKER